MEGMHNTEMLIHLSQKLLKQHLLVNTASFMISLQRGQRRFSGRRSVDTVAARAKVGIPSISFSNAALQKANIKNNINVTIYRCYR